MSTFNSLTITVQPTEKFNHARDLRVVTEGPFKGKFAVARRGQAVLVTPVSGNVGKAELSQPRIDLAHTRKAVGADVGLSAKAEAKHNAQRKAAAVARVAGQEVDEAEFEARMAGHLASKGVSFLTNMRANTLHPVKARVLDRLIEGATNSSPKAKAKTKAKAKAQPEAADSNEQMLAAFFASLTPEQITALAARALASKA